MPGGSRLVVILLLLAAPLLLHALPGGSPDASTPDEAPTGAIVAQTRQLRFEPNMGQYAPQVLFAARGPQPALLTATGIHLPDGIELRFPEPRAAVPEEPQPSVSHHFVGPDASSWRSDVPHYGAVRYVGDGIDLLVHSEEGLLRFDHVVAPGSDASKAGFTVHGATPVLQDDGSLRLSDELTVGAPRVYQDLAARVPVDGRFVLDGARVSYALGAYDPHHALVIDPTLRHATYAGNSGTDIIRGIAVRPSAAPGVIREVFITGSATNLAGPTGFTTVHTHPGTAPGGSPAISSTVILVAKYTYDVTARVLTPVWYAYIGHTSTDSGTDIAIDGLGRPVVVGDAHSNSFPTVNAIIDTTDNRGAYDGSTRQTYALSWSDAVALRLSANGATLEFSTFLGGKQENYAEGVAVDSSNNIIVVGHTGQSLYNVPYPVKNAYQLTHGDVGTTANTRDAFITKINMATSPPTFTYSTHLGAAGDDRAYAVAVDAAGNAYVTGAAASAAFPTTTGAFQTTGAGTSGFVAKFSAAGALTYSTRLGGSSTDFAYDIAVDASNRAWVTGETISSNFPVCGVGCTAAQGTLSGGYDAFVVGLNNAGSALVYGSFLGGSSTDTGESITIDASNGHVTIVGSTGSANFPVNGVQPATHANRLSTGTTNDGFVARIDSTAATPLVFSTFLGGTGVDVAWAVASDDRSTTYVAGQTAAGFVTLNPVQATLGGGTDGFVAIFNKAPPKAIIQATAPTYATVQAPTATLATYPTWTSVSLSSALSYAGDLAIGSRDWKLYDAATLLASGTGVAPSFSPLNLTTPGARTVCLTLTDTDTRTPLSDHNDTVCLDVQFTNRPPRADFTASPDPVLVAAPVQFTGTSTDLDGTITSRTWTFGDGTSSTQPNPSKTYAAAGTYTVTLTVTDDRGATATKTMTITVIRPPSAAFTVTGQPFTGMQLTFTNASTWGSYPLQTWTWDFGDGVVMVRNNGDPIQHTYATAGTYTTRLTVSDGTYSDTAVQVLTIAAPEPVPAPDSYNTPLGTPLTVAAPGLLGNDVSPTGSPLSITSNTLPGSGTLALQSNGAFTYTPASGFTGTVTFTYHVSAGGPTIGPVNVTIQVRDFVGPTAALDATGSYTRIQFADLSSPGDHALVSWTWNFGDGTTSTARHPTHTYTPGAYTVQLTVEDSFGLNATATRTIVASSPPPAQQEANAPSGGTVIRVPPPVAPEPNRPPVAQVTGPPRALPGQLVVLDSDGSHDPDGDAITFVWRQLDGIPVGLSPSGATAPSFIPPVPGTYVFELSVSDGTAATTATVSVLVALPPPDVRFAATPDGLTVTLLDRTLADAALARSWSFGDGVTDTGASVTHTYAQAGTYQVTLRVGDGEWMQSVHVQAPAVAAPEPTDNSPAPEEPASLAATGTPGHVWIIIALLAVCILGAVALAFVLRR